MAVLLFGGTQIPKLARSLGSAKNQFEQGLKEGQDGLGEEQRDVRRQRHDPGPSRARATR